MTRITPLMTQSMLMTNIENAQTQMTNSAQQVSSGLRFSKPSDDPYAAGLTMSLKSQASALDSYGKNATDASSWTQAATSSLTAISNAVQRVRELVVGAANGTNNATNLQADASEVGQLIGEIKEAASTQYNGQYLFAGTATTTVPYPAGALDAYQGNSGAIQRQIGPGSTIQVNTDLSQVLGNGAGSGDGKLLDTLRTIQADMLSANTNALGNADLKNLDKNLGSLGQVQANVGGLLNRITQASSRIQDLQTTNTLLQSSTQGVDIGQAMTTYTSQQVGYNAALQMTASIMQQDNLMKFLS